MSNELKGKHIRSTNCQLLRSILTRRLSFFDTQYGQYRAPEFGQRLTLPDSERRYLHSFAKWEKSWTEVMSGIERPRMQIQNQIVSKQRPYYRQKWQLWWKRNSHPIYPTNQLSIQIVSVSKRCQSALRQTMRCWPDFCWLPSPDLIISFVVVIPECENCVNVS